MILILTFNRLTSDTEIEKFVHLDMVSTRYLKYHLFFTKVVYIALILMFCAYQGNEVDLSSLHKRSKEYAEAKKRAIKSMLLHMNCLSAFF